MLAALIVQDLWIERQIEDKIFRQKTPLTDEQVEMLLDAIKSLPPYVFVMLGLYAGLRREEILGLKWDCVFLDEEVSYLSVKEPGTQNIIVRLFQIS